MILIDICKLTKANGKCQMANDNDNNKAPPPRSPLASGAQKAPLAGGAIRGACKRPLNRPLLLLRISVIRITIKAVLNNKHRGANERRLQAALLSAACKRRE